MKIAMGALGKAAKKLKKADVWVYIDAGHAASESMLQEDIAPDMLRTRLAERP